MQKEEEGDPEAGSLPKSKNGQLLYLNRKQTKKKWHIRITNHVFICKALGE